MEKIKRIMFQALVLVVNAALVVGGVLYFKNQKAKEEAAKLQASIPEEAPTESPLEIKARELQAIIDKNRSQQNDSIKENPDSITVKTPVVVKEVIPAKTTTVKIPAPEPKKTTKKS